MSMWNYKNENYVFLSFYCIKKKKERQAFKLSLEKDLEQLQKNMDSYPSQKNYDIYNISK